MSLIPTQASTGALAVRLGLDTTILRKVALVVGGAALTTVSAQITIPTQPVPFTLQTFAVLLCGVTMGARLGLLSQLSYLVAGGLGAPVFASHSGGPHILVGPTAGYLWAFPLAAGFIGWLADLGWDRRVVQAWIAMFTGQALILILGGLWLSRFVGGDAAWASGVLPFIPVEVGKAVALTLIMPGVWKGLSKAGV